jgi:aryl-alcohol dehydrogenase-like predicted oxidoreductase
VLPVAEQYGMGVLPWSPLAGGWLSGRYRLGQEQPATRRAERFPLRYDLSLDENRLKLERADALAVLAESAGLTLVHLAIAFVIAHRAVTSAIIGPRTMEQLDTQLDAADIVLDAGVLDAIDAIVPPGTNSSPNDGGYEPPSLADPARRRR